MQRVKFLGLVLVLALAFSASVLAEGRLIFEANFDGKDSSSIWWDFAVGDWDLGGGALTNYDGATGDTNAYAEIEQDADQIIYEWKVTFDSAGNQWAPAAGLHFMVDQPTAAQRGLSYLVFQDATQVQIYRTENGSIPRTHYVEVGTSVGSTHVYRVIYDRTDGSITVNRDGKLMFTWIDPRPIEWGDYISVRTNGTMATYHYIKIWAK